MKQIHGKVNQPKQNFSINSCCAAPRCLFFARRLPWLCSQAGIEPPRSVWETAVISKPHWRPQKPMTFFAFIIFIFLIFLFSSSPSPPSTSPSTSSSSKKGFGTNDQEQADPLHVPRDGTPPCAAPNSPRSA